MMESDVINDEITSGEAGCTWTRFEEEEWAERTGRDFRRACCLEIERPGIAGGAESMTKFARVESKE